MAVALSAVWWVAAVVVLCSVILPRLVGTWVRFRKRMDLLSRIPGHKTKLLFGNQGDFPSPNDDGLKFIRDETVLYPKITRRWLGPFACWVITCHPDTVKKILKSSEPKSRVIYKFVKPWLGEGLLISNGEKWSRNRRLLTPAFHFEILKQYIEVKNKAADVLLKKLSTQSDSGGYFEVFAAVGLFSLDVILQCAFSFKSNCQNNDGHPYIKAVNGLIELSTDRTLKPWLYFDLLYFLTPNGRKFMRHCDYVHKVAEDIIERRRKELQTTETSSNTGSSRKSRHLDFLDILLTARDETGVGLSPLDIRNEVDTFLFEGHDTTTSATSWTLYALAKHPDVQMRVQDEIDQVMADMEEEKVQWEDMSKLTYLGMCIKEGMRLYTTVPMIQRETTEEMTLDGYTIPAGTIINVALYKVLHNELVWPEPMEYRPERFTQENIRDRDPFSFIPFSAGPRNCIGQNFAMNEMKIVIARILRRFTLEVDLSHIVDAKIGAVMKAQNGIRLKPILRTKHPEC